MVCRRRHEQMVAAAVGPDLGGQLIPSFLGVTGLKSLTAGPGSRLTADVGVSFIVDAAS